MKKIMAGILAAALFLSFAGCGSSATGSSAASSAAASSAAASGAASSGSASSAKAASASSSSATPTIDAIKAKGKLVMMTNATFPPFEYVDDKGNYVGVDIELAQKIADKIGVKLEIVDMDFGLLIDALKGGKGDLVAAGMTHTAEREKEIDFSITYISMGLKVIVPVGSSIKSFDDLAGKKIAVQESTTADIYVTDNIKGADVLAFKSAVDCGNAVKSGNAEAAVIDLLPAQYMCAESPDKIVELDGLLSEEETAMGVAKGQEDLLAVVNEVLQEAMDDGSLTKSFNDNMSNYTLE